MIPRFQRAVCGCFTRDDQNLRPIRKSIQCFRNGGEVLALSPSEYGKRIAEETEKWAKVIRFSGAKPD